MANTHTHSVPRDTQGGRSLGQESGAILTHVSRLRLILARGLIGYEHQEDAVGGGGSKLWQTHTNTHTYTLSLVKHRADGASDKDRPKS